MKEKIDRRTFLRLAALSAAGAVGAACAPRSAEPVEFQATPTQKAEEEKPTVIVTATGTPTPKPETTATSVLAEIPTLVPQVPSESKFGRGGEYPEDLREWPGVESQEIRLTDWVSYWSRAGIFAPDSDEIHFKYFLDEKKKAALAVLEGVKGVYAGNIITAPLLEPKEKKEGSLPLEFIQEPPTRNGRFELAPDDPTRPLFIKEDNLYFDFEKGTFIGKNEDGKEEYIDARGQWIIIPEPTETPAATVTPKPTETPGPTETLEPTKEVITIIPPYEKVVRSVKNFTTNANPATQRTDQFPLDEFQIKVPWELEVKGWSQEGERIIWSLCILVLGRNDNLTLTMNKDGSISASYFRADVGKRTHQFNFPTIKDGNLRLRFEGESEGKVRVAFIDGNSNVKVGAEDWTIADTLKKPIYPVLGIQIDTGKPASVTFGEVNFRVPK